MVGKDRFGGLTVTVFSCCPYVKKQIGSVADHNEELMKVKQGPSAPWSESSHLERKVRRVYVCVLVPPCLRCDGRGRSHGPSASTGRRPCPFPGAAAVRRTVQGPATVVRRPVTLQPTRLGRCAEFTVLCSVLPILM